MPHQDDHSDEANNLPQPDLNPLLNPLLGQNMGRWAEVYFASAPEKREEALLDLLRELEAEKAASQAALSAPGAQQGSKSAAPNASQTVGTRATRVRCPRCGRENPSSHRFCGMCGAAVEGRGSEDDPRMADLHVTDLIVADRVVADHGAADPDAADMNPADLDSAGLDSGDLSSADQNAFNVAVEDRNFMRPRRDESDQRESARDELRRHEAAPHQAALHQAAPAMLSDPTRNESQFIPFGNTFLGAPVRASESSQAPGGREDAYYADRTGAFLDPEPTSSSYRVPLIIALASVLLALGYISWRSMQAGDSSHTPTPAPQSATSAPTEPSPSPSTASTPPATNTDTPDAKSPASNQAVARPSDAPDSTADTTSKVQSAKPVDAPAPQANLIPAKKPQAEIVSGNGGEELATAQRYLNGAPGLERNSTEAAKWLWKAIAKHNGEASLLLSDLYLKGDGVEKNCDQARVLLDAAAVRGVPGAAERLRHLQAFGCS